jgi:secondary thiamine-phosphate synthase enzyme
MFTIRHFTFTVQGKYVPEKFPEDGLHICNITEEMNFYLTESGVKNGFAVIQSLHTTLALRINEDEDQLMEHDFPRLLREIAPDGGRYYGHDDFNTRTEFDPDDPERKNGHSHCRAFVLSPSIQVIIQDGKLRLGKWQRVLLIELDGCGRKDRALALMFMGES